MPKCNHSHGGAGHGHSHGGGEEAEQKMNFATRFNQVGEYAEGVDSVTYFIIDNIKVFVALALWFNNDLDDTDSDTYTYSTISIALFLACVVATGGAYCHGILNLQHQTPEAEKPEPESKPVSFLSSSQQRGYGSLFEQPALEMSNSQRRNGNHSNSIQRSDDDMPELEDITDVDVVVTQNGHGHVHNDFCDHDHDEHDHHDSETLTEEVPLSHTQKFWIATDAISHGAGRAGALLAGVYSTMDFITKAQVPAPAQLAMLFCATLFGVGTSWAEVITCTESLRRYNNPHHHAPSDEEENLTMSASVRFNQVGEYVESVVGVTFFIIGNINLITDIIEFFNGQSDVFEDSGYIYGTAGASLLLATIISMGPAYCHGILNMLHQNSKKHLSKAVVELLGEKEDNSNLMLSSRDKFWVETDALCHGSSRAGSIMSGVTKITQFVTKGDVPIAVKLSAFIPATLFGIGTSLAERNTCQQTLNRYNRSKAKAATSAVVEAPAHKF